MRDIDALSDQMYQWQQTIVEAMQAMEGQSFTKSGWSAAGVGHGETFLIEDGAVFERAGINVSQVSGPSTPSAITEGHDRVDRSGKPFKAAGLSMIVHPKNPMAPSFHANFRYFEVGDDEWWFGGGVDLTPIYVFEEDVVHFHRTLKEWCDRHYVADYEAWKGKCDDYFYIRHRQEMRGVGGVFFDSLTAANEDVNRRDAIEDCVLGGLAVIVPAYLPIVERRRTMDYGERELEWQSVRRSRYVEFNLIYDRGTLFGLETGVNIDNVLMSMPPRTGWRYKFRPALDTPEGKVGRYLLPHAHDWVSLNPVPEALAAPI